ncbi:MAG: diaminopimelate epimerase [Candidatus Omnitrophica bacterium]|nr:diaminopimelate epimerase [Candidatus Omnitrophota bacterium]
MKNLQFHKMVASGNDFVVVDNRRKKIKNPRTFTHQVCKPHTGIGADGVLLLENSRRGNFKMRIINSDGSEAEACGNGFRCIALYARKILRLPASFQFDSLAGLVAASVSKKGVKVELPKPKDLILKSGLKVLGKTVDFSFLNTGVPHVCVFVKDVSKVNVPELGRAIRYHQKFKPKGTNVNFVQVLSPKKIRVRTYERGVEAETLACGTGSTASAVLSHLLGYTRQPVAVQTSSGEILNIDFKVLGSKVTTVTLEGKAKFVYQGTLH